MYVIAQWLNNPWGIVWLCLVDNVDTLAKNVFKSEVHPLWLD